MERSLVALAAVLALAACLSNPTHVLRAATGALVEPTIDHFPVNPNHNHNLPGLHKASLGMEQVAYLPASMGTLPPAPIVNLVTAKDVLLASLGGYEGDLSPPMSLLVADVKDPLHPLVKSITGFPGGGVESVAISDDARFGFLGTEFAGAVGIWTVDLSDTTKPGILSYTPLPTEGPHTLRYGLVGTHHLVFAAIAHVATVLNAAGFPQDPIPGPPDLRVDVYEFDPAQSRLPMKLLSTYQAADTEGIPSGLSIVHDTFLQVHPLTHQALLYVSHWDRGLRILDVSDPSHPKEIGKFVDPAPAKILGVHTVIPNDELVEGRHYTVVAPICIYDPAEQCYLRILDTTDPTRPIQVATWQLPDQIHGAMYTPEIFSIHHGKVYVPYKHAGVWVLDINSTAKAHAPQVVGYFFASEAVATAGASGVVPDTNSIVLKDDAILAADIYTGLHVLRLNPDAPTVKAPDV